ncbi:RNA polymerase subunit sigma-70, partial [Pseudomonas syringae]|uniref:sigma-70 region 4 domain-containing protein n=1 Tax=Pseudomonas syringae TaxID=317 RepID=UPI0010266DEC
MSNQLSSLLHLPARLPEPQPTLQAIELGHRLGKLSRRTRQIFLLSRLDGQAYADIAAFMNVDIARVERAMLRALGKAHVPGAADTTSAATRAAIQDQASRWYVHL